MQRPAVGVWQGLGGLLAASFALQTQSKAADGPCSLVCDLTAVPVPVGSGDGGIRQQAGLSRQPAGTAAAVSLVLMLLFSPRRAAGRRFAENLGQGLLSFWPGVFLKSHRAQDALLPPPEVMVHCVCMGKLPWVSLMWVSSLPPDEHADVQEQAVLSEKEVQ